jgi:hypothetical protein
MGGSGSLVCVGIGMTLGSHITPLARSYIETSDVVEPLHRRCAEYDRVRVSQFEKQLLGFQPVDTGYFVRVTEV